jgi:glucose/arabinose dehydrogenase
MDGTPGRDDPLDSPESTFSRRRLLQSGTLVGALALGRSPSKDPPATRVPRADCLPGTDGYSGSFSPPKRATVELERIAVGMATPVDMSAPADVGARLYVADQVGHVYVHSGGRFQSDPFLNLADRTVDLDDRYDERGLLGITFHPAFPDDDRAYVAYSAPPTPESPDGTDHVLVVAAFETGGSLDAVRPNSERRLLEIPQPGPDHDGGRIAFGPDGYLYVGVGDGGTSGDAGDGHASDWYDTAGGNGQDVTENLLGSVLRIGVDGDPYGIPGDNPLVGTAGRPELYAWGFRAPSGVSFGPGGRLFVTDVGEVRKEELNVVESGGNYGWNVREGSDCFDPRWPTRPPSDCPDSVRDSPRSGEVLRDPIVEYPHLTSGDRVGLSVVGGHRSYSTGIDALEGTYVFGDWSRSYRTPSGRLLTAVPRNGTWDLRTVGVEGTEGDGLDAFLTGIGRDSNGQLYALTTQTPGPNGSSGAVYRLVDPDGGDDGPSEDPYPLRFDGRTSSWWGTGPVTIRGALNPDLELVAGASYAVTWENEDGEVHDFQVVDTDGAVLVETREVTETGGTATTTFVATQRMAGYRCSHHPEEQGGTISVRRTPKSVLGALTDPDGGVGTEELQRAVSLWVSGDPVPETGGKRVTTPVLREVVRLWTTGSEV